MARKNRNAGAAPLTSPQTREERYLANIAGLVATKPAYPFTRTERYLDAISSGTSGLADRVTALETGKVNTLGKGDNLLINAHFYRPVNQRGIATDTWISATDPVTYNFIDRWQLTSGRAKLTNAGVVLEGTMIQTLEFAPNGDVVASVLGADGYLTPVYDTETRTFTITATGETLVAAKLELGTVQTLYSGTTLLDVAPDYGVELAKCHRYLYIIKTDNNDGALIGSGYVNSGVSNKQILVTVYTPVTMNPITSLQTSVMGAISDGAIRALDAASLFAQAGNIITLELTSNVGISTYYAPATAYIFNGGFIILSAE